MLSRTCARPPAALHPDNMRQYGSIVETRLLISAADGLRHFAAQRRLMPHSSCRRSSSPVSASWRISVSASTRTPIEKLKRIFQHAGSHRDIAVQTGVARMRSSSHHNPARVHHGGGHRSVYRRSPTRKTAPSSLIARSRPFIRNRIARQQLTVNKLICSGRNGARPNCLCTSASVALIPCPYSLYCACFSGWKIGARHRHDTLPGTDP